MTSSKPHAFQLDKCYVINLSARSSRWETFSAGIGNWKKAFGIEPERFAAVYGVELDGFDRAPWFSHRISEQRKKAWGGKAGAILSHAGAIREALAAGCRNVLILEDDSFLDDSAVADWHAGLVSLIDSLPPTWASVNLCSTKVDTPCRVVGTYNHYRLIEAAGAFGAVAYLINGHCLRALDQELPTRQSIWEWVARHKTIDRWYSQNLIRFGEVYVFSPALVGHREGPSDISMTADEIWKCDFSLRDVALTSQPPLFALKRGGRQFRNRLNNLFSVLRLWVKRRRGL